MVVLSFYFPTISPSSTKRKVEKTKKQWKRNSHLQEVSIGSSDSNTARITTFPYNMKCQRIRGNIGNSNDLYPI